MTLTGILSFLIIVASALLILVVYVQNPKGGGLSADFGGASQLGGVQRTNELIDKLTWGLATAIVVFSLGISVSQPKPPKPVAPQTQQQAPNQGSDQNQGQNQGQ
jgi:preprotein translocase subunit SecG